MKFRILSFLLLLMVGFSLQASAADFTARELIETRSKLSVRIGGPEEVELTNPDGCHRLMRGPDLALYLATCDLGFSQKIAGPASPGEIWRELEEASLREGFFRRVQLGESRLRVVTDSLAVPGPWSFVYPEQTSAEFLKGFPMDFCLQAMGSGIFGSDPLGFYGAAIAVIPSLRDPLKELRAAFSLKGLKSFDRQGAFLFQNFKNAPVLLCLSQMKDRTPEQDRLMSQLIGEDLDELSRSTDFVTRL